MASPQMEAEWAAKVAAREKAWADKQAAKEAAWAASHPGIALTNNILQNQGKGTWLDPNGDPAENAAFSQAWGLMGKNRELSAVNAAGIDNPNDPYAAGFARTKARIASGSDMANAFANYKLGQAARRSAALTGILGQQTGIDYQNIWNQDAKNQRRQFDWNSLLGGLTQAGGQIGASYLMGG